MGAYNAVGLPTSSTEHESYKRRLTVGDSVTVLVYIVSLYLQLNLLMVYLHDG